MQLPLTYSFLINTLISVTPIAFTIRNALYGNKINCNTNWRRVAFIPLILGIYFLSTIVPKRLDAIKSIPAVNSGKNIPKAAIPIQKAGFPGKMLKDSIISIIKEGGTKLLLRLSTIFHLVNADKGFSFVFPHDPLQFFLAKV